MKIKLLIGTVMVAGIYFFSAISYAAVSVQDKYPEADDLLQSFIESTVPSLAAQMENTVVINANKGTEPLVNKVAGKVYTFVDEQNVYTVMDFYSIDKVKTSKEDIFMIMGNDYLRPLKVIGAEYYTKSDFTNPWNLTRKLDTMVGLSGVELYGSQINGSEPFIRILLCFLSEKNPETKNAVPNYTIDYMQSNTFTFSLAPVVAGVLIVILIIWAVNRRNKRKAENS